MKSLTCGICGNTEGNRVFPVREMMNGTGEAFEYVQCARCGHLRIAEIPADLGKYYAGAYYSFHSNPRGGWRGWCDRARVAAMLGGRNPVGRFFAAVKKTNFEGWLRRAGLRIGDEFLDVGCGSGKFIRMLQGAGLKCTGIDPFLDGDSETPEGAHLRRRGIEEETGRYRGIMFSHSLEHVGEPGPALKKAGELLEDDGVLIVRIPLADSLAFWRYGADWFQLDAPRHLNLFTALRDL